MRMFISSASCLCIHHGSSCSESPSAEKVESEREVSSCTGECSIDGWVLHLYLAPGPVHLIWSLKGHPLFIRSSLGGMGWEWGLVGDWDKSHWWGKQQGMGHDGKWMWESFPVLSFWDQSPTFKLNNPGDGLTRFCFSISEVIEFECTALGLGRKPVKYMPCRHKGLDLALITKKSWHRLKQLLGG